MVITQLMTADDLALMPEDGNRYILIRGELIRLSPTNFRHGEAVSRVTWHFMNFADKYGGSVLSGECGFVLHIDPDTVLAPDVAYVRPERVPPDNAKDHYSDIIPDIALEIVSPSERPGLRRRKIAEYLAAGVPLVVYADPRNQTLTIYRLDGTRTELSKVDVFEGGDVMPGFQLPVAKFFSR
jgi:Uma2 family endonuclease